MSSNPSEFARRVLEAFAAAGHATDEEVGDAGGPSTTTMAKYRKVAAGEMSMTEPRGDVLKRIDQAAGWRGGSARALWRDQQEPEKPHPSIAEVLTKIPPGSRPGRVVGGTGMDAYIQWIAERLTEVEERLDLLESRGGDGNVRRMPASMTADTGVSEVDDELPAAAKKGRLEESGEFNT